MILYNPDDASKLLPSGQYVAELYSVTETVSRNGNDMWVLQWRIPHEGNNYFVKDYIVVPSVLWKLREMAKGFDKMAPFLAGEYQPQDSVGQTLVVTVDVQKDKSGLYPPKNVIARYQPIGDAPPSTPAPKPVEDSSDPNIPF